MDGRFRVVGYDHPDVVALTAEVQAEYVVLYGSGDETPVDPRQFDAPTGHFVVLDVDGVPAAMGGWRTGGLAGPSDAEIKRMFVRASHRRLGLARLVLAELERSATAAGLTRMVLETGTLQPEAIALYRASGYTAVEPFGFYADSGNAVYLGKTVSNLTGTSPQVSATSTP